MRIKRAFTEFCRQYSPRGSVQRQMMLILGSFIFLLLIIINTYPVIAMRNVVQADKERAMSSTASVVSSALSGLDVLTPDNVSGVIDLLNVTEDNHILVTNESRIVVYDSWGESVGANLTASFPEMNRVFAGKLVFLSDYDIDSFTSQVCAPVMVNKNIIGSVYLVEEDTEQADMILGIRNRLAFLSGGVGVLAIALSMLLAHTLTLRIRDLAGAVRVVQEGYYDGFIEPRGSDEIAELTEEFNAMTETLRQNEQMRRRFVSDASHELKTPLASIRLLSDSILQNEGIDRETTVEFVGDIGACAERLQHMTEKLLDLSRMDGGAEPNRTTVDLAELTARAVPMLEPLARHRGVQLRFAAEDGAPVFADGDDLYQIVFNLVENAIKYNVPEGSVEVTVLREGGNGVLRVADTGIGIPEADVPNIFSRFYRVDKARSREAGGSGLGLSIVKDAVILHGGEILVAPNVPQGTVFTVTFPIATDEGGSA